MRHGLKRAALFTLILVSCCASAWALGTEQFGNAPLNEANYTEWPGLMPVVNDSRRVYHTWVNGNEHFYYRGDTAALNDCLNKFLESKSEVREVVLRPDPGTVRSFDRSKTIPFNWNLHINGGISRHVTTRERGDKVWSKHPVLSVYVGGEIDLRRLEIPKGLTVTSLTEVKKRTLEGLGSKDKTVRGWGSGQLAALDPYDTSSRDAVAALLKDPDEWVRLNAVHVLPTFGKKAETALPLLREALLTEKDATKAEVLKSIEVIEKAEDRSAAERLHAQTMDEIQRFLSQRGR